MDAFVDFGWSALLEGRQHMSNRAVLAALEQHADIAAALEDDGVPIHRVAAMLQVRKETCIFLLEQRLIHLVPLP